MPFVTSLRGLDLAAVIFHHMLHVHCTGLRIEKLQLIFNLLKDKASRMTYWKGELQTTLQNTEVCVQLY